MAVNTKPRLLFVTVCLLLKQVLQVLQAAWVLRNASVHLFEAVCYPSQKYGETVKVSESGNKASLQKWRLSNGGSPDFGC